MQIRRPATWKDIRNLLIWITLVILYLLFVRDPDPTPWNSIHVAALDGNIEAVKQHLANGTDVNVKNNFESTPLHSASGGGHKEIANLLIAKSADVNARDDVGQTPLDFAEEVNEDDSPEDIAVKKETADLLRKHGGKSGAEFSIHTAAQLGNIESVKQHLAAGADVNARDDDGFTPLHRAALEYNKKIPELLVAKGADVNAMILSGRYKGYTPLDFATTFNRTEIAELLRKHGGKTGE